VARPSDRTGPAGVSGGELARSAHTIRPRMELVYICVIPKDIPKDIAVKKRLIKRGATHRGAFHDRWAGRDAAYGARPARCRSRRLNGCGYAPERIRKDLKAGPDHPIANASDRGDPRSPSQPGSPTMAEISLLVEYVRHNVQHLRARMASDEGASAVEYGLIVSLIAAAVVTLVATLGGKVAKAFTTVNNVLP